MGKRRFHASSIPYSFPWMVSHSFLVIIFIVWVNKMRLSANSSSLFRTSQRVNWSVPPIIILLEPSKKFSWSWTSGPIQFCQSHSGNTSNISKINQDKFHTQLITMGHIDLLVKTIPLLTAPCFWNRMGPLNRALHFGRKLWVAKNHLLLWNAVIWLAIFMGSLVQQTK